MNKGDNRQRKKEVLYEIEEVSRKVYCVGRELLQAANTFQKIAGSLPEFADVRHDEIPAKPRTRGLPEPGYLRERIDELDSLRRKMQKLKRQKARLYAGRG